MWKLQLRTKWRLGKKTKFNVLTDHHIVFEYQETTGHFYLINSSDFMFIFKIKIFIFIYIKNTQRGTVTHQVHSKWITFMYVREGGPCSSVGIATGYGLDGPGIESRWGARFSTPVQTGPGAHPASCTMDTGSFPGVKSGRRVTLTPHPLLVSWSWKSRAIPLLPLWAVQPVQSLSACTRVHFMFLI